MAPEDTKESDNDDVESVNDDVESHNDDLFAKFKMQSSTTSFIDLKLGSQRKEEREEENLLKSVTY